jgi:hypothetical protein
LLHKDNALAARDIIFWIDLLDETVLFGGSEEKGELEHFLWSALPHFSCHSACNIDPLSRGIGVQNWL